jgi:ribosome biogenesis GTPase / thiamine phosphate phosphatase
MPRAGRCITGELSDGIVVGNYGRRYRVEFPGGRLIECSTRGKKSDVACGDRVSVRLSESDSGVIETVLPRATLLYRSDARRQKLIAANVTQAIIVVAAIPRFYDELINRCLAACAHGNITALILLNKIDLPESVAAMEALQIYQRLGYRVLGLAAKHDVSPLKPLLTGQTSVLVGQSGMGKSTLINSLIPEAQLAVAAISVALDSGRHTTTRTSLYHLDSNSHIIDSPGMQLFGLNHLSVEDTAHAFVELRPYIGQCRFRNCRHVTEPGCEITNACAQGAIAKSRLASYRKIIEERLRAHAQRYS